MLADIDILLPLFKPNLEQFEQCVLSLNNQTYKNFRVIIINDGGSFDYKTILPQCKFEYICLDLAFNQGISSALNLGIEKIKSPFVARMDADDVCYPQRLEMQLKFMTESRETDIIFSGITKFTNQKEFNFSKKIETDGLFLSAKEVAGIMLFKNFVCHPTAFFRSTIFENFRYSPMLRKSQDYDLWMRMLIKKVNIRYFETPLLYYRVGHKDTVDLIQRENFFDSRRSLAPDVASAWFGPDVGQSIRNLYSDQSILNLGILHIMQSSIPKKLYLKELIRYVWS